MFKFKDIYYPLKVETKIIKTSLPICNYENFLIEHFKKFVSSMDSNRGIIIKKDAIHFKNQSGLNCIVPYTEFKQFNESLKFFNPESWENQWALFFGGIIFNQSFPKNLPIYKNTIKKIYRHYTNNNIKDILDIYALKEAQSLIDFLSAKMDFSSALKSKRFSLTSSSLVKQFIVPTNEIRGNLIRQKQALNGFIFFLEQHLNYKETFFYSDIQKKDVSRKENFFSLATIIFIGVMGVYLSNIFRRLYGNCSQEQMNCPIELAFFDITFFIIHSFFCLTIFAGMLGIVEFSTNIIINKKLPYVDLVNLRKLLNYFDDNPDYFSSLKCDPFSIMNIEIMEAISLLKQMVNYYDETLQLIDQLFDEDDFLPPLNLERFPGHLLKNSFFKLDRNPDHVPKIEKNNNFTIG